jgi:hypothetical protein
VTTGLQIKELSVVNRGLELARYVGLTSPELERYGIAVPDNSIGTEQMNPHIAHRAQKTRWGPTDGKPPGIICYDDSVVSEFISWTELKPQIELRLLNQLGAHIPPRCMAVLDSYRGRENWLVRIVDSTEVNLGYVVRH